MQRNETGWISITYRCTWSMLSNLFFIHLIAWYRPSFTFWAFNTSEKVPSPFFATRRYFLIDTNYQLDDLRITGWKNSIAPVYTGMGSEIEKVQPDLIVDGDIKTIGDDALLTNLYPHLLWQIICQHQTPSLAAEHQIINGQPARFKLPKKINRKKGKRFWFTKKRTFSSDNHPNF